MKKALYFLFVLCISANAQTTMQVYDNIVSLRAIDVTSASSFPDNTVAKVLGYYNANDGGGGEFRLVRSSGGSMSSDNGGTIIAPDDITATTGLNESTLGRWIRVCDPGFVNVLWFGARPYPTHTSSTSTDSLLYIQRAYDSLPLIDNGGYGASENGVMARSGILYFPFVAYPPSGDSSGTNISSTTYFVSDTIKVGQRITLRGDGPSRVTISFIANSATSAATEKFLIYFSRYPGSVGGPIGANYTFDTGVEGLSLYGNHAPWSNNEQDKTNPGSSGIFMDAAQMSFVRNCWINQFGLRCLVGAPYTLENLSAGGCRGPAFDLSFDPKSISGSSMGASGDGKVHATNLFFGDVGNQHYNWATDSDGDHYPAIRLRDCRLFVCNDLRVEQCPKVIKADNCGQVWVTSMDSVNYAPLDSANTTAITLKTVGRAYFKNLFLNLYDNHVRDVIPGSYMGPADLTYGNDIQSWERCNVGQTIFTKGDQGTKIYSSGSNFPFRVVAKPNDGASNTAPYEGSYVAEFFKGDFSGSVPLEADASRLFGIRKNGQFDVSGATGYLPTTSLTTSFVQPTTVTFNLPAIAVRAVSSVNVTLPTGTNPRPGDIVKACIALMGIVSGVGGNDLPTGVYLKDTRVSAANQVQLRFVNDGAATSVARTNIHYKITVERDTR